MGLFQKAMETYDANSGIIGVYQEGHDPLAPIGHTLTSANIEIIINKNGKFVSARKVDKKEPKIIIPVTEESNGRTSGAAAHPLCEQLKYLAPLKKKEYELYLKGLHEWKDSKYAHPFLAPILAYTESRAIIADLLTAGVIESGSKYDEKQLVCWRVLGIEGEEPACWKNQNLFQAFIQFYTESIRERSSDLCMLEGKEVPAAIQHPKGIIAVNGNAKLISANDTSGFTYRGRFSEERQAATIGYTASQKAHNAIRWLASEQGVREFSGNRIFLCWCPQGKAMPKPMRRLRDSTNEVHKNPTEYRQKLKNTLFSYRKDQQLKGTEDAVIAAFDAATTGRLALTYYCELSMDVFLDRMQAWEEHCCWYNGRFGIQTPNLFEIVECAYGTQRGNFLEPDDRIQRQHLQRLLNCKAEGGVFPADIVKILVERASTPLAYTDVIWRRILFTACSALQKYRYDTKQGGNEMDWNLEKKDRSFQYGRLLAVMERAESDYYYKTQETRQTNAIKFMSEYRQRPFFVFERINRQLHLAYLNRIDPWQANRYERLTGEIFQILSEFPEEELNRPLSDLYLMGYELQRNAFFAKKEESEE